MKKLTSKSTVAEVKQTVVEITNICNQYDFWNRYVYPYGWRMTVRELVQSDGWKNYEQYTKYSKSQIRLEINVAVDFLESWVKYQQEPTVRIYFRQGAKQGTVEEVKQSLAELFIQTEIAELA